MTLFLDITNAANFLARNPQGTGVQRVTLSLARDIKANATQRAQGIVARHNRAGSFTVDDMSEDGLRRETPFGLSEYLGRYKGRPLKRLFHGARLACHAAARVRRNIVEGADAERLVPKFTPADTVLNFEALANAMPDAYFKALKKSGASVAGIVHDLIPVVLPHLCWGESGRLAWLRHISRFAQLNPLWVCNSKHTESDLRRVLDLLELGTRMRTSDLDGHAPHVMAEPRTCVVPLAHEFPETAPEFADVPQNFILFVGHRGKRKGMRCLAEAFSRVSEAHPGIHLVLAGSGGGDGVILDGRNIHSFDHPTDGQLAYLYRKCLFTVYPSEYEGWGLPVGESLWFGKNVIAARNTSMPEVGGEWATYFTTNDPRGLANAMFDMIVDPKQLPADLRQRLRTWHDVASDLGAALTEPARLRLVASA